MIDTILGLEPKTNQLSGTAHPAQWLIDWVGGGAQTASGERIDSQTALTCAAVKAAVTVLSETVASVPVSVYERKPNGDKRLAVEHRVHRLIHSEPNEDTSSFNFRETLQGHLCLWGNGYAEIERAIDRTPIALWQRSPKPEETKPVRRSDVDGKVWYRCRNKHGGEEDWIRKENIFHVPGLGFDGMVGYNPISLSKETIGGSKAAERFANELYANDAAPRGHYEHPARLGQDAHQRLKDSLGDRSKRHTTPILDEGMKFAANSMDPESVQLIEARRFGVEDIARLYRIPLHLLQELTNGTSYAALSELGREFIVYTMMPWFGRWTAEINRKLLEPPYFAEFNANAFMQGDPKTRAEFYKTLQGIGVINANQICQKENMNSIGPQGDVYWMPLNMAPVEQVIDGSARKSKEPGPATKDEKDEEVEEKNSMAAEAFFLDAKHRMHCKEAKAAGRWAKEPATFLQRAGEFYDKHRVLCSEAFASPVACGYDPYPGATVQRLVSAHIEQSYGDLLTAAECPPGELPERVESVTSRWLDSKTQEIP